MDSRYEGSNKNTGCPKKIEPLLMRVWTEMDYRLDICRVTKGAHIESLLGRQKLRFIAQLLVYRIKDSITSGGLKKNF
jgi:hypothetical protein